jgi:hypothetical protein
VLVAMLVAVFVAMLVFVAVLMIVSMPNLNQGHVKLDIVGQRCNFNS